MTDRNLVNALGTALQALRAEGEDIIVSVGAHKPSADCPTAGHVSATVRRGGDEFTGEAVSLDDAIRIARGRLTEMVKRREAEKELAA